MSIKKDLVINNLKVIDTNEVYNNWSAITVSGGVNIKKGLKIGFQSNPVNGLISFDNDNLLSYSDKYGWDMLNNHNYYSEIIFPEEYLINEKNIIKNKNSKNIIEIDLPIDDLKLFYFKIPEETLEFDELKFNLNIINNNNNVVKLIILNNSPERDNIKIEFNNNYNFHYIENYNDLIMKSSKTEFELNIIEENIFIKNFRYLTRGS
jgi:hypothetical protein